MDTAKLNNLIVVNIEKPPVFGKAMLSDSAVIVRRATANNTQIRLTRLHRLLQQRFPRLTVKKTHQLVIQLVRLGLIES